MPDYRADCIQEEQLDDILSRFPPPPKNIIIVAYEQKP